MFLPGADGNRWTGWARTSTGHFSGFGDALPLHGRMRMGIFGGDYQVGRLLAGLAVSHGRGDGSMTPTGLDRGPAPTDQCRAERTQTMEETEPDVPAGATMPLFAETADWVLAALMIVVAAATIATYGCDRAGEPGRSGQAARWATRPAVSGEPIGDENKRRSVGERTRSREKRQAAGAIRGPVRLAVSAGSQRADAAKG